MQTHQTYVTCTVSGKTSDNETGKCLKKHFFTSITFLSALLFYVLTTLFTYFKNKFLLYSFDCDPNFILGSPFFDKLIVLHLLELLMWCQLVKLVTMEKLSTVWLTLKSDMCLFFFFLTFSCVDPFFVFITHNTSGRMLRSCV